MKDLITDLGHLVAFKKLNRDDLAEAVGTTRQNLISAFKGRRPLPTAQLPPLRCALGLAENYRFEPDRVHALTVNQGETQRNLLLDVLWRVMSLPVRKKWILRGIGEANRMGLAYVFEDDNGVLIAVRNDDALLAKEPIDTDGVEKDENELVKQNKNDLSGLTQLFSLSDDSQEVGKNPAWARLLSLKNGWFTRAVGFRKWGRETHLLVVKFFCPRDFL